mgnify:CR=1 FL=1
MRLTYIYHSGFAIETEGYAILIDYFQDTGKTPDTGFVHDELLHRPGTLYYRHISIPTISTRKYSNGKR